MDQVGDPRRDPLLERKGQKVVVGVRGEGQAPHAWFVAFAPAEAPQIAVAVIVLDGGSLGSEATGGAVAAPIAKAVMEAALGR